MHVPETIMQVPEAIMQVPGGDILWPELMAEGKETLLEKMKANGTSAAKRDIFQNLVNAY